MDKLKWLQAIVLLHPEDAEAHYWLGQELEQRGQALEALQIYSSALTVSQQELQRLALIQAISLVTSSLQSGSFGAKQPVVLSEGVEYAPQVEVPYQEKSSIEDTIAASGFPAESEINAFGNEYPTPESKEQKQPAGRAGLTVFSGGKDNPVVAQRGPVPIKFSDVAGLHKLKKTIQLRIISPFQNQSLFSKFRKKAGGGVLLYGPLVVAKPLLQELQPVSVRLTLFRSALRIFSTPILVSVSRT
ncbi:hypothetical protein [Paenibacillus donghaensis]|uniref:hypothetical protein n=1 Tax=Paenibacillus donghaensis TaxID=414771 RepID=UPI0026BA887A